MGLWKGVGIKAWAQCALISGKFLAWFCSPQLQKAEKVAPEWPRDCKAGHKSMGGQLPRTEARAFAMVGFVSSESVHFIQAAPLRKILHMKRIYFNQLGTDL